MQDTSRSRPRSRRKAPSTGKVSKASECIRRWLLEVMARDHMAALRMVINQSRTLLEPVLSWAEVGKGASAEMEKAEKSVPGELSDSDWATEAQQLFATVEQMERLTACLFAGANLPGAEGENASGKLLAVFSRADSEFQNVEAQLAKKFGGRADLLTLGQGSK